MSVQGDEYTRTGVGGQLINGGIKYMYMVIEGEDGRQYAAPIPHDFVLIVSVVGASAVSITTDSGPVHVKAQRVDSITTNTGKIHAPHSVISRVWTNGDPPRTTMD